MKARSSAQGEALVNPAWLSPAAYVDFLNCSFPSQWDRPTYDFYLGRPFNGRCPELLVIAQEGRIVSGLGMAFRQLQVGDDAPLNVAVLLAAATRPDARGQGHYVRLLQLAREQARLRGCAALVAFARRENSSGRSLRRLGGFSIPTFYLVAPAPTAAHTFAGTRVRRAERVSTAPLRASMLEELCSLKRQLAQNIPPGSARFYYARDEDWVAQFVERPGETDLVHPTGCAIALSETVRGTRRLQWLAGRHMPVARSVRALLAQCQQRSLSFFMFSVSDIEAAAARSLGCRIQHGYLMVQPTGQSEVDWSALACARAWSVQSGDRL